jgi:hypothetical protein
MSVRFADREASDLIPEVRPRMCGLMSGQHLQPHVGVDVGA